MRIGGKGLAATIGARIFVYVFAFSGVNAHIGDESFLDIYYRGEWFELQIPFNYRKTED